MNNEKIALLLFQALPMVAKASAFRNLSRRVTRALTVEAIPQWSKLVTGPRVIEKFRLVPWKRALVMAKACFPFTRPLSSTTAEIDETVFRLIVHRPKIVMPTETTKEVPQDIVEALRSWDRTAGQLRFAQVFLGVLGTSAALAVTTFTLELSPMIVKGLSFTAALCIGLITAFDLNGRANTVRRAWRHLNTAALRYRNVPAASLDSVVDAYSQAEEMLGDVTFQRLLNERRD